MYAQATPQLLTVMQRIDRLDQQLYHGKHQLRIGLAANMMTFPLAWYLRDYPATYFDYPITGGPPVDVIIADMGSSATFLNDHPGEYKSKVYSLLWWPDQSYDPPACVSGPTRSCNTNATAYPGVGPLLWLSYGDSPPKGARPELGLIAERVWNWVWTRQPLGEDPSVYYFTLLVHQGSSMVSGR